MLLQAACLLFAQLPARRQLNAPAAQFSRCPHCGGHQGPRWPGARHMFVALAVFDAPMSWLKAVAPLNMLGG